MTLRRHTIRCYALCLAVVLLAGCASMREEIVTGWDQLWDGFKESANEKWEKQRKIKEANPTTNALYKIASDRLDYDQAIFNSYRALLEFENFDLTKEHLYHQ